jgi:hypothetical protein
MTSFFEKIGWFPGIGDPSLMGWFTVLAYFYTAYKSRRVGSSLASAKGRKDREAALWLGIALLLLFLGINKQLDLQSFFTASLKYHAQQNDWYADRRVLQLAFLGVIAVVAAISAVALTWLYRKVIKRHIQGILGVCFLLAFVFVRASSFHDLDSFLGSDFKGLKFNWILELGGIGLILLNARALLRVVKKTTTVSDRKIDIIR